MFSLRKLAAATSALLATATLVVASPGARAADPIAPGAAARPTRVMALGDSITYGGCWRARLWQRLQGPGRPQVDFVGSAANPDCVTTHDRDNEGHPSIRATTIVADNLLPGWLATAKPDVVMMHLGTNDVWGGVDPKLIRDAYDKLVDQMRANNPAMRILVAQILPMGKPSCGFCQPGVEALNKLIPAWAAAKSTTASPITVVDQWSGFDTATDTTDGVHPNNKGGEKLADRWYMPLSRALAGDRQDVIDWLSDLPHRADKHVVSGLFGGFNVTKEPVDGKPDPGLFSLAEVNTLHERTGRRPGMLGCDYASWNDDPKAGPVDPTCNASLVDWWRQGGLVTVSVHLPNPDEALNYKQKMPDFTRLLDRSNPAGDRWYDWLDKVAAGLGELKNQGVPVLFRPLHEMNGTSFWWSDQDPEEFKRVWKAMHAYLTNKGLDNLVWVYGPDANYASRLAYYPGPEFVDVVGLSAYQADLNPRLVNGYEEMLTLNKPFGFTEIGPPDSAPTGTYDFGAMAAAVRTRFPAATFFQAWSGKFSLVTNRNADVLMADPTMAHLGDVDLTARTPGSPAPAGPRKVFADFEAGSGGWAGFQTKSPVWAVKEWATTSPGQSLKADVDLGAAPAYLSWTGRTDLTGRAKLSAAVRTAPWGDHRAGTTAKLYVRTGSALTWHDGGSTVVGPNGTVLSVDLTKVTGLNDVREIGVRFEPAPGANEVSAAYVDDVVTFAPSRSLGDFESGVDGWTGENVSGAPSPVEEWFSQGGRSLKANVDLSAGESKLVLKSVAVGEHRMIRLRARVAPWGEQGSGVLAKINVKYADGRGWQSDKGTLVDAKGTMLTVNIDGIATIDQLEVSFQPPKGAHEGSAIYIDNVELI
ncbi:glycosyl hydrolase [Actinoplanes sp. NPDC051346]|uniref:glycosyl hydrolase n=1 Tax=Actinoplanes sp. NPDC051346 TaxID=3155048 RepID=UPI00341A9BD1